MTQTFRRWLCAGALGAGCALPLAQAATVIDFEPGALTGLYLPGDTFAQGGYTLSTLNDFGIIDTASALGGTSPTGDATQFYFNANDGALGIARSDATLFSLQGFSAAFVPLDPSPTQVTVIVATGIQADNTLVTAYWAFGPSGTSHFPFTVYASPASFAPFASVKQVTFKACSLVGTVICSQPTNNNGQFAIDDIILSAVPEPGAALLMALGLMGVGGLGLRARRNAR